VRCSMPKINRIRITNFSYNNNNRHIIDEIFDFYNGENALLSLANGGGKSVLVQAIFQPIVPRTKLLGRAFSDFFIGKKDPVYIMIEWILDDQAGYLLTGIGVSPSINYNPNADEDNLNLRFYTFSHFYDGANKYDIKHIPVTEERNNGIIVTGYNELKKLLVGEANKGKFDINCYNSSKDEQSMYERKLNTYSISRNEWKELMVNINQAEHGVSEVFAQCKNSRQVMEQWVIKYIEKVLDKSSGDKLSDHQKLEQMMEKVTNDEVENEKFIHEYQAVDMFATDLKDISEGARNVCGSIDEEEHIKSQLASAYHFFSKEIDAISDAENRVKEDITQCKNETEHIKLEKMSFDIYLIEEEVDKSKDELETIKDQLAEVDSQIEKVQFELRIQQGAREYEILEEKIQKRAELIQSLVNANKNQEQLSKEMNQIRYSLRCYYIKSIEVINKELIGAISEFDKIANEKSEIALLIESKNELKDELIEKAGKLKAKIEAFLEHENQIITELNIALVRNPLLNELNQDDIKFIQKKYVNDMDKLLNEFDADQQSIRDMNARILVMKQEASVNAEQLEALKDIQSANKHSIEIYEKDRDRLQSIVSVYCNDAFSVFEKDMILSHLQDYHHQWHQQALVNEAEMNELTKMISGLNESISYIPGTLIQVLKENNIDVYTGEMYLRSLNDEDRERIIHNNPLLPYGIIVTEKESRLIPELLEDTNLGQLVPVFKHSEKEIKLEIANNHLLSNPILLKYDQESLTAYVAQIVKKIEKLRLDKKTAEDASKNYLVAINVVDGFAWKEETSKELDNERVKIMDDINKLKYIQQNIEDTNNQNFQDIDNLRKKCRQTEQAIENQKSNMSQFEDYIEKNNQYMLDFKTLAQVNSQKDSITSDLKSLNDRVAVIIEEMNKTKENKKAIELKLKVTIKNYEKYKEAIEDVVIEETEVELKGKLDSYESKYSKEVSSLERQIEEVAKDIERVNVNLRRLNLVIADVRNIVYSEVTETELSERLDRLISSKNESDKVFRGIEKKISVLNGKCEQIVSGLNGASKLEQVEIRGDFEVRTKKLNQSIGIFYEELKRLSDLRLLLSKLKERITGKIDNVAQIKGDGKIALSINTCLEEEIKDMIGKFTESLKQTTTEISKFQKTCKNIKDKYKDTISGVVQEAIKGIYTQIDNITHSFEKYYYLTEQIYYYDEMLINTMKLMQSKMDQLEHSKKDLIEHAYVEAMNVYYEIPKIVDNSSIEIDGKRKKILEIQYDKIQSDEIAKDRIKDHIQLSLVNLTQDIKNNESESKTKKEISKLLSTKELLNVISNLENFKVKAYKVDFNEKNRCMMSWEEIVVKNSGGEKFVAYFSLLVALIAYSRKNARSSDIFKKKEEGKVLIMDNPFGPITSVHLLKPMFDIAKKYDTQLICLSDIKEGAVINSFNLVYMIKIRQNMMKQEYLEIEENNFAGYKASEKLEKAYLYSKMTQMSLLDD